MNNDDDLLSNLENDVDYNEEDEENQNQFVNNYVDDEKEERDDDIIDEEYEEYLQKVADTINHEIFGTREEVDEVYQLEPGYWIARMLAGTSAGRQIKRSLFKLACFLNLCGFALLIITNVEAVGFEGTQYFSIPKYGLTLLRLMWFSTIPVLYFGFLASVLVKYWASFCTNKTLVISIVKIYCVSCLLVLFMLTWMLTVLYVTFEGVDWGGSVLTAYIFPCYLCTFMFGIPLVLGIIFYCLDIWAIVSEVESGRGFVLDPDLPDNLMDMNDVGPLQIVGVTIGMPFIILIQIVDIIVIIVRYIRDLTRYRWRQYKQRWIEGCCCVNINKFIGSSNLITHHKKVIPKNMKAQLHEYKKHKLLDRDREREERIAREAKENNMKRKADKAEAIRKNKQRLIEEKKIMEKNEKMQHESMIIEKNRKIAADESNGKSTINTEQFKAFWQAFNIQASFKCNIKEMPSMSHLSDHFHKQGFHVVFANVPTPSDIEICICNIRQVDSDNNDVWFISRFLIDERTVNVVMKAENEFALKKHVRFFELGSAIKMRDKV